MTLAAEGVQTLFITFTFSFHIGIPCDAAALCSFSGSAGSWRFAPWDVLCSTLHHTADSSLFFTVNFPICFHLYLSVCDSNQAFSLSFLLSLWWSEPLGRNKVALCGSALLMPFGLLQMSCLTIQPLKMVQNNSSWYQRAWKGTNWCASNWTRSQFPC